MAGDSEIQQNLLQNRVCLNSIIWLGLSVSVSAEHKYIHDEAGLVGHLPFPERFAAIAMFYAHESINLWFTLKYFAYSTIKPL
jgi:hypothetical protein